MALISTVEDEDLNHNVMEALRVRAWRAEQLRGLGLSRALAYTFADLVDWHALAALTERGCPPEVALEIIR